MRYPSAMFNAGAAYYNGTGVATDPTSAYAWFMLAQEAGSKPAVNAVNRITLDLQRLSVPAVYEKIGDIYEAGIELPQSYIEAIKWYRKATKSGRAAVRMKLARLLILEQNYIEARPQCEEAAKQKSPEGLYCMGLISDRGLGVAQNPFEAAKWYKRAADMNHGPAELRLGEIYWKGTGVKPNPILAYMFSSLAASAKVSEATQEQAKIEAEMNSKQLKKAKRKTDSWLYEHSQKGPSLRR